MTTTPLYRSGLRNRDGRPFQPALALGGHAWFGCPTASGVQPVAEFCVKCFTIVPAWAIDEGFYPRPCLGGVAALPFRIEEIR